MSDDGSDVRPRERLHRSGIVGGSRTELLVTYNHGEVSELAVRFDLAYLGTAIELLHVSRLVIVDETRQSHSRHTLEHNRKLYDILIRCLAKLADDLVARSTADFMGELSSACEGELQGKFECKSCAKAD